MPYTFYSGDMAISVTLFPPRPLSFPSLAFEFPCFLFAVFVFSPFFILLPFALCPPDPFTPLLPPLSGGWGGGVRRRTRPRRGRRGHPFGSKRNDFSPMPLSPPPLGHARGPARGGRCHAVAVRFLAEFCVLGDCMNGFPRVLRRVPADRMRSAVETMA